MTRVSQATGSGLLYAGLETGGTKCVCAIGTAPDDLRACTQFATTTPALAPGDGAHPRSQRLAGISISWSLPLSWRLSRGARLRPGPGSTLGQAGAQPTCRPSCLVAGSPLLGPGSGHLYLYPGATAH